MWDHFSGLILDTSATANVWFNSDFILLSELIIQLHIFTSGLKTSTTNPCKKTELDPISPQISTLAFIFLCSFLSCYPHFHLVSLLSCFFLLYSFFRVTFLPVTFFSPHCYFFSCYLFSCYFFRGKIVNFFLVSLPPSRLLTFFPVTFFSCYLFSYPKLLLFFLLPFFLLLSFRSPCQPAYIDLSGNFLIWAWNFFAVLLTFSSFSLLIWKNCIFTMQKIK